MKHVIKTLSLTIGLLLAGGLQAEDKIPPTLPTQQDARLQQAATSPHVWNGVTVTKEGRVFASFTQSEGPGLELGEVGENGKITPYPDAEWNQWKSSDPEHHFLHGNALRIGPEG